MESRSEKYFDEIEGISTTGTRSGRNARLYRQVYGKYDDLDNLPLEDNTDEIDMERLKELVLNSSSKNENREIREHLNVLEQKKRNIDEQKVYDINKILEKAKYENKKLKGDTGVLPKIDKSILETLQSTEISLLEIREARERQEKEEQNKLMQEEVSLEMKSEVLEKEQMLEERLSMTRELKYHNLAIEDAKKMNDLEDEDDLSLDLFEDLKPTENTITTKPIVEEVEEVLHNTSRISDVKTNLHSSDTSDIDIIKPAIPGRESDFFTSSYEFSQNDFSGDDDDDFFDEPKKGGIFKIVLLFLAITVFVGVIVYFVLNYGLGV